MSGCAVCVYDVYEEAVGRFREEVEGVKRRLGEMGVDAGEWPAELRGARDSAAAEGTVAGTIVKDAFEQLERELAAKRARVRIESEDGGTVRPS